MSDELVYARNLATQMWFLFYRDDAPEWEPADDLLTVLTQIDNMVAGLSRLAVVEE